MATLPGLVQSAPSLRDRKKAQTRDALVAAAMRLFRARGFEATTVDEIASAADVSRRTFFRYFPTKEAVVFPERDELLQRFEELLAAPEAGEAPFATVRRACLSLAADYYMAERGAYLAQRELVDRTPALLAYELEADRDWELAIAQALDRNARLHATDGRVSRRARVLAGATMGVIRATLQDWRAGGCEEDLPQLGEAALDLLQRGIGAD